MFAIYTLYKKGSNHQYLGISASHLLIKQRNKRYVYDLSTVQKLNIDLKKKLIPLIGGGIVSSLSLLAMVLDMVTFETIALLSTGLLTFYFGFAEYVVIEIKTAHDDKTFWMSAKHRIEDIRPLINMASFYLEHQHYPPLYVQVPQGKVSQTIHSTSDPSKNKEVLKYSLFSNVLTGISVIMVDPQKLDHAIQLKAEGNHIGFSDNKVNQAAVIGIDQAVDS